ncbi:MAG TPA: CpsD/CapB family tyrosine-protein kinase [Candidatus Acidoferrales bacterium]
MSRLFKALSDLNAEIVSPEVQASLRAAQSAARPSIPKPSDKSEPFTLKVVLPMANSPATARSEAVLETKIQDPPVAKPPQPVEAPAVYVNVSPQSRLVALTNPNGLGAEKFRALVTRFDHLRGKRELKSFQVTSSVINEGKTLLSANIGVTLAKYSGAKTLLVEGDLHRPSLTKLFGLDDMPGLGQWWCSGASDLGKFVYRLNGMPMWFLSAGQLFDQPSDLLRSAKFANAFTQLAGQFEWTVVDSPPMLPIVDVNLWSRLVDGTLLVVREGVAPVKALKKGLQALDHPKLIGVVMNEATESGQTKYEGQYYAGPKF